MDRQKWVEAFFYNWEKFLNRKMKIMRRSDFVQSINAIAIHDNGEEYEFDFEISNNATEKDKVDKAFEIAYCKFINLEEVRITN